MDAAGWVQSGGQLPSMELNATDQAIFSEPSPEINSTSAFSSWFEIGRQIRKVLMLFYIYMSVGTLCFYFFRYKIYGTKTNGVLDAVYFTVVLLTSVGYRDLTPHTTLTIILASIFAILGTVLMGLFLSIGAQVVVKQPEVKQETLLDEHQTVGTVENPIPSHRISIAMMKNCVALVLLLVVLMGFEMYVLVYVEKLDLIQSLYCIASTITSVGSDKCFSTKYGRSCGIFVMLYAAMLLSLFFFTFAELQTQMRQRSFEKQVLGERTTREDFHAADLDGDGVLVISEFTLYKLRKMKKFNQEDMAPIMAEFRRLVRNNNGTLTLEDIIPEEIHSSDDVVPAPT